MTALGTGARNKLSVVPAQAGIHNHECGLYDAGTTNPFHNIDRGVWVPAFAGTTLCLRGARAPYDAGA